MDNRDTIPTTYTELEQELLEAVDKQTQWTAFTQKSMLSAPSEFSDVLSEIGDFLTPVLEAIINRVEFDFKWEAGGPWQDHYNNSLL